jgi:hypothetical protein
MRELTDYQFWLLNNRVGAFGWRARNNVARTARDEAALKALMKRSLVEQLYEGDAAMVRPTDAGRALLAEARDGN